MLIYEEEESLLNTQNLPHSGLSGNTYNLSVHYTS